MGVQSATVGAGASRVRREAKSEDALPFPDGVMAEVNAQRDRHDRLPDGFALELRGTGYIFSGNTVLKNGSVVIQQATPDSLRFCIWPSSSSAPQDILFELSTRGLKRDLAPGVYRNAQRAGFVELGHPGIDITMDNRGSNTLEGEFRIHEIKFDSAHQLEKLIVEFRQRSGDGISTLEGWLAFERPTGSSDNLFVGRDNFTPFEK